VRHPVEPDASSAPAPSRAARDARRAWLSLALSPIAVVIALALGQGLLGIQGYQKGGFVAIPAPVALSVGVPAVAVLLTPALLGIFFGRRARRNGWRGGVSPALVGGYLVAAVGVLTLTALVTVR
jgi:Na+/proline symporter